MHEIPSIFQFDRIFVLGYIFFFNDSMIIAPLLEYVAENVITMCDILQKIGKIR